MEDKQVAISELIQRSCVGSGEGSWRGPFSGIGELGGSYRIDPLGDGWQRNLSVGMRERNLILSAIRNAYSFSLSSSGLEHIKTNKDGSIEVLGGSNASRVLRYPNRYQTMIDLVSIIVSSLFYYGNAYCYARRNDRHEISEIIPLPPHFSRAVVGDEGSLFYDVSGEFEFMKTGDVRTLVPARDVLHVKLTTHRSLLYGESPISDAAYTLGLNSSILSGTASFHANMGRPSGVLSTDLTLSGQQMAELRAAFAEQSKGFSQGHVPILGGGLKWQPLGITAADAEVIATYNMTVLDLCRLFRIPPQLLGLDNVGAASSTETLINQWRATGLLFFAEVIERSLERFFELPRDEEIRFDLNNIARADMKAQIESLAMGVQNGIFSPNEARSRVGLPAVEFGDSPRVQAQQVRLEDAKPAPSAIAAPSAGKEDSPTGRARDDNAPSLEDRETSKFIAKAMIQRAMENAK